MNVTNCFDSSQDVFNLTNIPYFRDPYIFKPLETTDYVKITFYVIVIIVALLGNISVILTVTFNRSMRTTINFYVLNLAVADLMICICCMWVHLISTLTSPVYALGPFMCKFNNFNQMACLTCSVLTLSAISCDRFIAIMFPLHVRITKQRTGLVISAIWIVSIVVSIPFLIYKHYYVAYWENFIEPKCGESWPAQIVIEDNMCIPLYPSKQYYYTFVCITLFFLPVAIMATTYSLIVWRLWISEVPGERHAANLNVQHRAKKKVIKMVCVVLIVFVLCWMPLQIIVFYSEFYHVPNRLGQLPEWTSGYSYFAEFIAYANSAMNPIIYGGFNKTFRDAFCTILRCGFQRRRYSRPRTGVQTAVLKKDYHHYLCIVLFKPTLSVTRSLTYPWLQHPITSRTSVPSASSKVATVNLPKVSSDLYDWHDLKPFELQNEDDEWDRQPTLRQIGSSRDENYW